MARGLISSQLDKLSGESGKLAISTSFFNKKPKMTCNNKNFRLFF